MKKLILGLMLAVAGAASADSYLYWMFEDPEDTGFTFDSARVVAARKQWADQTVVLTFGTENYELISGKTTISDTEATEVNDFYSAITTYQDGYAYWVELLNDGEVVAHAGANDSSNDGLSYEAALAAGFFGQSGMSPATAVWKVDGFTAGAIPEPTSGLLLLIGMAGLALRRKRRA